MSSNALFDKVDTPPSLKERAYSRIKDAILQLKLKPGAPIPSVCRRTGLMVQTTIRLHRRQA